MNKNSSSTLYGRGVFSTISVFDNRPFVWAKHWRRLTANAEKLGIDISDYNERSVADSLAELIEKNGIRNGLARITFSDDSPSELWSEGGEKKTRLSIITTSRRGLPEHFKLTVSPHHINTTSTLVGIKSCNYLEHLMAFDEAKSRGFHEAIRMNERGDVASGCLANVFWLKDEKLFTPSLKTGCLAGTTREFVLENLECEEVETGIDAVHEADKIFLTSAGIGIVRVAMFESRRIDEAEHPIMSLLPRKD